MSVFSRPLGWIICGVLSLPLINSTVHSALQVSPFEFLTGLHPRSLLFAPFVIKDDVSAAIQFVRTRLDVQRRASQYALEAQQCQEHYANQRRRHAEYQVGDWVLLSTRNLSPPAGVSKLAERFIEPY